jgi:hypothetical protein
MPFPKRFRPFPWKRQQKAENREETQQQNTQTTEIMTNRHQKSTKHKAKAGRFQAFPPFPWKRLETVETETPPNNPDMLGCNIY